jgi:hypothetical protein
MMVPEVYDKSVPTIVVTVPPSTGVVEKGGYE